MDKHWYKNAIIYSLDIEAFMDSNDDGIGDFPGLMARLPYLSELGINCVWLLPFYDSPNKDDGYDVRNYFEVDKRLGDLGHFTEFVNAATKVGIRILIDLVVNHTSEEHFWFKEAVKDKASKYWDFYVWANEKPENDAEFLIFGKDQGNSNWEYHKEAKTWYYHTFYQDQPDLNMTNPEVQEEVFRIVDFWLKLGISGFRNDAAPHMIREKGNHKFDNDPHDIFRRLRKYISEKNPEAVLLAEVDVEVDEYMNFFGKNDQMHMLFNFYINNYLFLTFARERATPLINALHQLPELSYDEQMVNFLRNHDELDLERLSPAEREEVFKVFAPEEDMRIFDRGIRRRLAPMFKNDFQKLEMAYSLLLTLPGTPVLRYGQELGMGEDLTKEGRKSVRTVMQWTAEKNGGFSNAPTKKLAQGIITKGSSSYKNINAKAQSLAPESLLNWMIKAIWVRKKLHEIGTGKYEILKVNSDKVIAMHYKSESSLVLILHNFSNEAVTVKVDLKDQEGYLNIFGNVNYENYTSENDLELTAYGYRWMKKRILIKKINQ